MNKQIYKRLEIAMYTNQEATSNIDSSRINQRARASNLEPTQKVKKKQV